MGLQPPLLQEGLISLRPHAFIHPFSVLAWIDVPSVANANHIAYQSLQSALFKEN